MKVSESAQEVFMKLVAWECFGEGDFDPKDLLRQVPLSDLQVVSKNIKDNSAQLQSFACISMVELELLFKSGMLKGDWFYWRKDGHVSLNYEPLSFPMQCMSYEAVDITTLEHMTCTGAMA